MSRKLLFLVFSDEACRQNHALMYAQDLQAKGHEVRVIIEGPATAMFREPSALLVRAKEAGLIAGACRRASGGCAGGERNVAGQVRDFGVELLDEMQGHAAIGAFVEQGFELVVF
jgi:hypothetical protein